MIPKFSSVKPSSYLVSSDFCLLSKFFSYLVSSDSVFTELNFLRFYKPPSLEIKPFFEVFQNLRVLCNGDKLADITLRQMQVVSDVSSIFIPFF